MNSDPGCSYDLGTMVSEGKLVLRLLKISLPSPMEGRLSKLLTMRCSGLISKMETRSTGSQGAGFFYGLGSRTLGTLANVNISA